MAVRPLAAFTTRARAAGDPVGEVVAGLREGLGIAVQAERHFMVGPAAPHAIGIQRVPAGAVQAVDGAGAAGEGAGQGGGRHALLVVEIVVVAGDELPGEIAVRARISASAPWASWVCCQL